MKTNRYKLEGGEYYESGLAQDAIYIKKCWACGNVNDIDRVNNVCRQCGMPLNIAKKKEVLPHNCIQYQTILFQGGRETDTVYMLVEQWFHKGKYYREVYGYVVIDDVTGLIYEVTNKGGKVWILGEQVEL